MKRLLVLALALALGPAAFAETAKILRFDEFKVNAIYRGPSGRVVANTPLKRGFITRIRNASKQPPNFAGRFVITTWGCGTACLGGAVVDKKTGEVYEFPGGGEAPPNDVYLHDMMYRPYSSLLVLSNVSYATLSDEDVTPRNWYFFNFNDGKFELVHSYTVPEVGENPPRFEDFAIKATYNGPRVKPEFESEYHADHEDEIIQGAKQPVNFAGRYVIKIWKDPDCDDCDPEGALINIKTGELFDLPSAATDLRFRPDSALISAVIPGWCEHPDKQMFYLFTGEAFYEIGVIRHKAAKCQSQSGLERQ